jgi:hypothetical protein
LAALLIDRFKPAAMPEPTPIRQATDEGELEPLAS